MKFKTFDDVEVAIKRDRSLMGNFKIFVSRCSGHQMVLDLSSRATSSKMSNVSATEEPILEDNFKYIQIRGLPWAAKEDYIFGLFPGFMHFFSI